MSTLIMAHDHDDELLPEPLNSNTRTNGELFDVKVFFRRGYILSTRYNETGLRTEGLSDNETIEFTLEQPLFGDLKVEGRDVGSSKKGFWIDLNMLNPPGNSNADLTFEIKEDEKIIAKNSNPISLSGGETASTPIMVPYLDESKESHTFKTGSLIKVKISAIIEGLLPVGLTYDSGRNTGYLFFSCDQTWDEKVAAHSRDSTSIKTFYPNWPNADQRVIVFKGSVKDKFGAEDISGVDIELDKGTSNIMERTEATYVPGQEDDGYFELEYQYQKGLPTGDYLITAYILDYSGNEHITTETLTMLDYGVYLVCSNNSASAYPGLAVSFQITVYNIGGSKDTIRLKAEPSPAGWDTSFQGGDNTKLLDGGSSDIKTLNVIVPESAAKNDKCIVDVTGISNSDESQKYLLKPPINVVAEAKFNFKFELLTDSTKTIESGEDATYNLKLSNIGSDKDFYTVKVLNAPLSETGWSAKLTTTNPNAVKISDLEYDVELQETEIADFTLTVTAPDQQQPTVTEVKIDISATSGNITGAGKTIKHTTTTKIKGYIPPGKVVLSATSQTKIADPGNTIEGDASTSILFSINADNEDDNYGYYVELSIKNMPGTWNYLLNMPGTWNYLLNPTDFDMDAAGDQDISLTIDIPETEYAGSYTFEVEAEYTIEDGNNNGIQTTNLNLAVTIPEVYDVLLQAEETEKKVKMGESVEYVITVTDLGNVNNMDIEIITTDSDNWDIELSKNTITLGNYGLITNIKITIEPLSSASDKEKENIIDVEVELKSTGETIGNKIKLKTTLEKDTGTEVANFLSTYWYLLVMVIVIIVLTFVIRSRLK
jgi:uncharacterized membrane protein